MVTINGKEHCHWSYSYLKLGLVNYFSLRLASRATSISDDSSLPLASDQIARSQLNKLIAKAKEARHYYGPDLNFVSGIDLANIAQPETQHESSDTPPNPTSRAELQLRALANACLKAENKKATLIAQNNPSLVNLHDWYGLTPFQCALVKGEQSMVNYLATLGAEVNKPDLWGQSNLELAASFYHKDGSRNRVLTLLQHGYDLAQQDSIGNNGLHTTCFYNIAHWEEVRTTLENLPAELLAGLINQQNTNGATALHYAALVGNTKTVEWLLARGANPNAPDTAGYTPLHYAVFAGKIEAVKRLLAREANLNAADIHGYTPLHHAVLARNIEMVEQLLSKAANPNAAEQINLSARGGNLGHTPLHLAVLHQQPAIVEYMLQKKVDLHVKELAGDGSLERDALLIAAATSNTGIADMLLQAGANPNTPDSQGFTALDHAIARRDLTMIIILLHHGAIFSISLEASSSFALLGKIINAESGDTKEELLNFLIPHLETYIASRLSKELRLNYNQVLELIQNHCNVTKALITPAAIRDMEETIIREVNNQPRSFFSRQLNEGERLQRLQGYLTSQAGASIIVGEYEEVTRPIEGDYEEIKAEEVNTETEEKPNSLLENSAIEKPTADQEPAQCK